MRLINTQTLKLSEFYGDDVPPYAILSHTWGQNEVTFQEWTAWQNGTDPTQAGREGFVKIRGACKQARSDMLDWLWVDTNCIDKTSSSELTEAINSMYTWYRDSEICYAFLADVPPLRLHGMEGDPFRAFRKSRWFTRGWTLQELLAPKRIDFFANTWTRIGNKSRSLMRVVHEITTIELSYLLGMKDVAMASVAKRMSWLSRRRTTRTEDIAYCMLGIFEINMPLLYGEGVHAFTRLQNEIVRHVHDHTLFCWTWDSEVPLNWVSILAPSPHVFQNSGDYVSRERFESLTHYSTTNLGLLMSAPALYTLGSRLLVMLDAGLSQYPADQRACIPLRRPDERAMVFERVHFPAKPLTFPFIYPHRHPRYSIYALSRPSPSTLKSRPGMVPSKYGVLLLIEPSASRFIAPVNEYQLGLPANRPLLTKSCQISTYPPGMFDETRDLFFIPLSTSSASVATRKAERHTLTVKVTVYGPDWRSPFGVQQEYYIFFAIQSTDNPQWHCSIVTGLQLKQETGWVSSAALEVEYADRYFHYKCSEIWKLGTSHLRCDSSDQLYISIGQRMNAHPDVETRWCMLSERKNVGIDLTDQDGENDLDGSDNDSTSAQAERN
ncbi:hypothetical protein NLU13_6913 [Sarocladium strictum]|uniref:Heterokaryon incompatibility domain-containing protein n=1 Tax=Sarocladium strictum TaxID=5046 RepID=A0AA39GEU6_SARSR|nr:hypothetical protein NLU13_6913 [Sarocladium strictum]